MVTTCIQSDLNKSFLNVIYILYLIEFWYFDCFVRVRRYTVYEGTFMHEGAVRSREKVWKHGPYKKIHLWRREEGIFDKKESGLSIAMGRSTFKFSEESLIFFLSDGDVISDWRAVVRYFWSGICEIKIQSVGFI